MPDFDNWNCAVTVADIRKINQNKVFKWRCSLVIHRRDYLPVTRKVQNIPVSTTLVSLWYIRDTDWVENQSETRIEPIELTSVRTSTCHSDWQLKLNVTRTLYCGKASKQTNMALTVKAYLEKKGSEDPEIRRFTIDEDVASSYDYLWRKLTLIFPGLSAKTVKLYWKGEWIFDDASSKLSS